MQKSRLSNNWEINEKRQWLPFQEISVTKGSRHNSLCLDCFLPCEESDPSVCCRTESLRHSCSQSSEWLSRYPHVRKGERHPSVTQLCHFWLCLQGSTSEIFLNYFCCLQYTTFEHSLEGSVKMLLWCISRGRKPGTENKFLAISIVHMCIQLAKTEMLNQRFTKTLEQINSYWLEIYLSNNKLSLLSRERLTERTWSNIPQIHLC